MHSVTSPTNVTPTKSRLTGDVPRQPQRRHRDKVTRADRTVIAVREALARADRPVRARVLALDLGLPAAEVTAGLRRLQDVGAALSHARRWVAVDATAEPEPQPGHEHPGQATPAREQPGPDLP
ncbi:hypothetical protein Franean1_6905 [Parafrankia sp. EAN1pec]|uniref:hypothetical protein n=1 Tax=Parafrankia sp. (strain EAN1pec) TaxID=298653 RepID=UPI0000542C6E|nr:hypothetical protein Franean1_6905 [Frankia sp. EAN1pec]